MYYAIHHVNIHEDDDYMDQEMFEELSISYNLHYFLIDEKAGEAREMDVRGNRLRTLTDQSGNSEWPLTGRILSIMQVGDTLIAVQPSQWSEDRKIQMAVYRACLDRRVCLLFLKTPYLNSDNFTEQITDTNRRTIESIIDNLLSVPVVSDGESQEKVLKLYEHQKEEDYELKKTSSDDI